MLTEFTTLYPHTVMLRDRQKRTIVTRAADLQTMSTLKILEKYTCLKSPAKVIKS